MKIIGPVHHHHILSPTYGRSGQGGLSLQLRRPFYFGIFWNNNTNFIAQPLSESFSKVWKNFRLFLRQNIPNFNLYDSPKNFTTLTLRNIKIKYLKITYLSLLIYSNVNLILKFKDILKKTFCINAWKGSLKTTACMQKNISLFGWKFTIVCLSKNAGNKNVLFKSQKG